MESLPKSTYRYSPIEADLRQVRLLTLFPGLEEDEIEVSLENVVLEANNKPAFEALSYAWGSVANTVAIKVFPKNPATLEQSQTKTYDWLFVTQSLEQALRRLRYIDRPRVLWADAVCIDQDNVSERSHQVNRMGDMYKFANRVVVWLGPSQDNSDMAMDLLSHLGAMVDVDWKTNRITPSQIGQDEPHWADDHIPLPYDIQQRNAILHFVDRPWFNRLWVVQEVRLSSEAELGCGSKTIHWALLKRALWCIHAKNILIPIPHTTWQRLLTIGDVFNPLLDYSLHHLVRFTEDFKCADPRDRIYSILAICQDSLGIEPDYSLSVAEVYRDATERHIREYKALHILAECAIQGRTLDQDEGPTWVPLWSVPKKILPLESRAGSAASFDASMEGRVLRVAGVQCATITTLVDEPFQGLNAQNMAHEIFKLAPSDVLTAKYRTGCSLLQALCGTRLCSDFMGEDPLPPYDLIVRRAISELMDLVRDAAVFPNSGDGRQDASYASQLDQSAPAIDSSSRLGSRGYLGKVRDVGRGRQFMTTAEGFVGTAPPGTQTGDVICVVLGCRLPMILRPVEGDANSYRVVGNCFLYGIGNGEAILGPMPVGWQFTSRHGSARGAFPDAYRNNNTGEEQKEDPRLSKLGLRCRYDSVGTPLPVTVDCVKQIGVDVKYFDLV